MYRNDVPLIAAHAWGSPQGLHDVIEFVLLTIRQPLYYLRSQREDIAEQGAQSRFLFSHKRTGWLYARDNAEALWSRAHCIEDRAEMVEHFMQVPGLGMVKAAFVVQCLGLPTACLDQHNCARLGIAPESLKVPSTATPALRRRKLAAYLDLCDQTGGAEFWWDEWCAFVAGRRGSPLKTPEEVSRFHAETILMTPEFPQQLAV